MGLLCSCTWLEASIPAGKGVTTRPYAAAAKMKSTNPVAALEKVERRAMIYNEVVEILDTKINLSGLGSMACGSGVRDASMCKMPAELSSHLESHQNNESTFGI